MQMNAFRRGLAALLPVVVAVVMALPAQAAPYAEMVIDARTGEVLRSRSADTRLHPASLTKMMTLYVAFEAVRLGEISLDTPVRISRQAAATPYALGFRAGSKVQFRHLLRAAAVRSSNDGATAIAEAISGSVPNFSTRMNRTARALGMNDTTFKNPHGLTQAGHLSTARDMTTLGRRLFYDYPQYYNLFGRRSTDVGLKTVRNTNRRVLGNYRGADGIKTGFTRAAGFNLVSSAERDGVRVIATVFGGTSSVGRDQRIMELLDMGFERAPRRVAVRRPALPVYDGATLPGPTAPTKSMRPVARGTAQGSAVVLLAATAPTPRPSAATQVAAAVDAAAPPLQVVTRGSTSGGRVFSISLDPQPSQSAADKLLLRAALQELDALDDALRKVERVPGGFEPSFVGLSEREADIACTRLRARNVDCAVGAGD
jgi:D-alanyl-D-alanine carboxypeptidase